MPAGVQSGIIRPAQVDKVDHIMTSVHNFYKKEMSDAGEERWLPGKMETWRISIHSVDPRITDLITRLISSALYSNTVSLQNAEENVLKAMGLIFEIPEVNPAPTVDITLEQPSTTKQEDGNGNG